MAKQAVGPVIRLVDKIVLVAAGGVFLYAVAMFGVMSPNKIGEPGEQMGPAEVDQKVKVAADSLRERLLNATPKQNTEGNATEKIPSLDQLTLAAADPLALAGVPPTLAHRPVPFAPPVREVAGREIKKIDLVKTIAVDKPRIVTGRSGVELAPPSEIGGSGATSTGGPPEDVNWVTVAAMFNIKEQQDLFANAGYERDSRAWVVGIELQRRELLAGGDFTEWRTIPTVMPQIPPQPPPITLRNTDSGMVVSDESQRKAAEAYRKLISEGSNQVKLMRPAFFPTPYGDRWTPPTPAGESLARMDIDYGVTKRDLYNTAGDKPPDIPDANFKELYTSAQEALKAEDFRRALAFAEAARKKTGKTREQDKADDLILEIKQARKRADEKAASRRLDLQMVWTHDAAAGSVRSGHRYQYRMRLVLLNSYFGKPSLLNDPQAATRPTLERGDWSPPSDVVEIPRDTMFFVKRSRPQRREVSVEVFKWFRGVWLARPFKIDVGMPIGSPQRVRVPPDDERVAVDFDTGARVVDIDFHRPFYERRRGDLRKKISTTAVVYVDATGRLLERIKGLDDVDPLYKKRRSEQYEPK